MSILNCNSPLYLVQSHVAINVHMPHEDKDVHWILPETSKGAYVLASCLRELSTGKLDKPIFHYG